MTSEKWEEAFRLGKQNKELLEMIKLPYANYLMKNDEYEKVIIIIFRPCRRINS